MQKGGWGESGCVVDGSSLKFELPLEKDDIASCKDASERVKNE